MCGFDDTPEVVLGLGELFRAAPTVVEISLSKVPVTHAG